MTYIKDSKGIIHKLKGMCGCGREGKFSHAVRVEGRGPLGSNKPLAVYVCTYCK